LLFLSTQDSSSIVPRQALANGTEYSLSTKMTPANVFRTFSEPKEKEKVLQKETFYYILTK